MRTSKRIHLMGNKDYYESTWKTDNVGTSEDNQITLPTVSTGTYNCIIKWGDGSQDYITAYDQAELTHTYASIGTYTIKIYGKFEGFQFNNGGDCLKLLSVEKWGSKFKLNAAGAHFYGCSNLIVNATDKLDIGNTTNMAQAFRGCTGLTTNEIKFKDTSNVTTIWALFYGCTNFNGNITTLNTDNCNSMADVFGNCTSFNKYVNHLNTSNVTSLYAMFYGATSFNQLVNNWNTNNVEDMRYIFYGCTSFNQDISNFNIESVTQISNILAGATAWSTINYDLFLISAAGQDAVNSLTFDCSSTYTDGGEAAAARADLIATDLWTINDLGAA